MLDAAEVHVYLVDLDGPVQLDRELLSPDELERADRFRFPRDRDHFTVARAKLRRVLAGYAGVSARHLCFEYGPHGKPRLSPAISGGYCFNLSHSHGRALIAVAKNREVGVDIEYVRREVAEEKIAARFFSDWETNRLAALPREDQAGAFFRCWTRKEAYLKARGDGIYYGLHHFSVSLDSDEPPTLLANTLHPEEVGRWSLQNVDVGPDYAACVAAERPGWRLIMRQVD